MRYTPKSTKFQPRESLPSQQETVRLVPYLSESGTQTVTEGVIGIDAGGWQT